MSDSNSDMENAQRNSDGILESDKDVQARDQVFRRNTSKAEKPPAPAIPMDALLALMQTIKMASAGPKTKIQPPIFDSERDLSFFLRQFSDVAEANG